MRPPSIREVRAALRRAGRRGDLAALLRLYVENRITISDAIGSYYEGRRATRFALHNEGDEE